MIYHVMDICPIFNGKIHDMYNIHFRTHEDFVFHESQTLDDLKDLVNSNIGNIDIAVIVYMPIPQYKITNKILEYINSLDTVSLKLKIILFTNDFWVYSNDSVDIKLARLIFTPVNHYVITFAKDRIQLETILGDDYSSYDDKFIYMNIWCCYNSSFTTFNKNPLNKVALSGRINKIAYPERITIKNLRMTNVDTLNYIGDKFEDIDDTYAKRLNKYLCCFSSSPYAFNLTTKRKENLKIIVQKYFEILSTGSLLLCPITEEKELNDIGLYNNVNCIMIKIEDAASTINYITDPSNRKIIDIIRHQGYLLANTKLTSNNKFQELLRHLDNLS